MFEQQFYEKTGEKFNVFYKQFRPKLIWHLMKLSESFSLSDAEEVADEGFIKAIDEFDKFDPEVARFSTWLFTISKRIMFHKKKQKNRLQSIEEEHDGSTIGDFLLADNRDMYIVDNLLTKKTEIIKKRIPELDEQYATVLTMREVQGLTYKEIAAYLNINENTIKSQIRQGRKYLQKLVANDFKKLELSTFWDVENPM